MELLEFLLQLMKDFVCVCVLVQIISYHLHFRLCFAISSELTLGGEARVSRTDTIQSVPLYAVRQAPLILYQVIESRENKASQNEFHGSGPLCLFGSNDQLGEPVYGHGFFGGGFFGHIFIHFLHLRE